VGKSTHEAEFEGPVHQLDWSLMVMVYGNPFIAMDESEATGAAEWQGYLVRIIRRDGDYFSVDSEFNPYRLNLEVDAGLVTHAYFG